MKNVLITGGAGFIGSNLAKRLHADGWHVTILDTLSPQIHTADPENSALFQSIKSISKFIHGDVTDRPALTAALAGQDAVVHYAAETGTGQSMYEIERYNRVNVGGTALLLDIMANKPHQVRRLVVASSRSIYGEGKYLYGNEAVYPGTRSDEDMQAGRFEPRMAGHGPLTLAATDEESRIHPSSVYGITKQVQEQLVLAVCPTIGVEGVALRYQNVYGPGQSLTNPYTGILSIFSNLIMSGKPINVFEDGLESRDFVLIDDVVEATALALTAPAAAGKAVNVGTGVPVDVLTVVQTLQRVLGRNVPVTVSGNYRLGDIRHNFACMKRAADVLGFVPRHDFESGMAKFCAWALEQGPQASGYERSIDELREKGLLK